MIVRRVARPLIAAPFIRDGIRQAVWPADEIAKWRKLLPGSITEAQLEQIVRAHGAATAALAVLLALGIAPRAAALGLACSAIETAAANHPFERRDGVTRTEQVDRFIGQLGRAGAALLAAADLEGKPSVRWRIEAARHEREDSHKSHKSE